MNALKSLFLIEFIDGIILKDFNKIYNPTNGTELESFVMNDIFFKFIYALAELE